MKGTLALLERVPIQDPIDQAEREIRWCREDIERNLGYLYSLLLDTNDETWADVFHEVEDRRLEHELSIDLLD